MKIKKIFSLILGAFFSFGCLTGCQNNTGNSKTNPQVIEEIKTCDLKFFGSHCSINHLSSNLKESTESYFEDDFYLEDDAEITSTKNLVCDNGSKVSFIIVSEEDYKLPQSITIEGCSDYIYNKHTGVLSFTINDDVIVGAVAPVVEGKVTFFHRGKNISLNHKNAYSIGETFESTLIPNEHFYLPDHILSKGLGQLNYNNLTGEITGIVENNIKIDAVGIYDDEYFVPIITKLKNCKVRGLPELAEIGKQISFSVILDTGCVLDRISCSDGVLLFDRSTNTGTITPSLTENSVLDVEVIASFATKAVSVNITNGKFIYNCLPIFSHNFVGYVLPDYGYSTPDTINVSGLSDLHYDKYSGILLGKVTGDISIVGKAIMGKRDFDTNKVTIDEFVDAFSFDTLSNCTSFYHGIDDTEIIDKTVKMENNKEFKSDLVGEYYEETLFEYDYIDYNFENINVYDFINGAILKSTTVRTHLNIYELMRSFDGMTMDDLTFNDNKGCYEFLFDDLMAEFYFADQKFIGSIIKNQTGNVLQIMYLYDYGTTKIERTIPDEYYTGSVNSKFSSTKYGKGSKINFTFGSDGSHPLYVSTEGLINVSYNYITGAFKGTINDSFNVQTS